MRKKEHFVFLLFLLASFGMAAETPPQTTLPLNWQCNNAKMKIDENKVITVNAEKHLGGIQCALKPSKERRVRVTADVKGMGKITAAFKGSYGWNYNNITLTDEWKSISIEYGEPSGYVILAFLSMNQGPAEIQVRNIKAFTLDVSGYTDAEIPSICYKAIDHPGPNGKVTAAGMYGKRWYHIVKMPIPENSRPLYYYVHMKSEGGEITDLYWMAKGQRTNAANTISAKKANGKWAWIKTGPYKATILPKKMTLGFSGDPKIGVTVDKVVLSTNGNLTDDELDKQAFASSNAPSANNKTSVVPEKATSASNAGEAAISQATLPLNWQCYNAKMKIDENKVLTVNAEKNLGGIQCVLKPAKERRVRVTADVKGMGKITAAFKGSYGWNYNNITLTDEWKSISIEYGEPSGYMVLAFLSMNQGPAEIQIRNIKAITLDISGYTDAEIPYICYKAVDHPGPNGKVTAAGMYGKRWYHIVKMPIPENSRPIYYYVHMKSEGGEITDLYWMAKGQRTNAANTISAKKANGKWAWIRTGPYKATMLPKEMTLGFSGDPKIGATVDKVVLSTNGSLTDDELDQQAVGSFKAPSASNGVSNNISLLSVGQGTPVIDGKLDDRVWQANAIAATPFLVQRSTRFAARQTEVRFLYDDKNLYVSFRCLTDVLDPVNNQLHALKANLKKHDSDDFYKDDGVELLFNTPAAERIYDLAISASGAFCDATAPKNTAEMWSKRDYSWESGAKVVCARNIEKDNGYWSAEIAIPWASLGGKPTDNSIWQMVAARFEQDRKECSAFQPIAGGIHTMEAFSSLKFVKQVPGATVKQMPAFVPGDNSLLVNANEKSPLEISAKVTFDGNTENFRSGAEQCGKLTFPLNGNGNFQFTWSMNNRATLQEIFRSPEYSLAVISSSLTTKLSNASLTVNGATVLSSAQLRSGGNSLVVRAGENSSVKLVSNSWTVPFPDGWKKAAGNEYTLTLFSNLTWVWPDWTQKGLAVTRGGVQQLLVLPSGIPETRVSDYTVLLDLPKGMKLLSASGFYRMIPNITVSEAKQIHYMDTDFSRYAITINTERGYRREFDGHELLSCLIATESSFVGETAKICVSAASVQAGTMEVPNVIPVRVLPQLQGKQPKNYHIQMWSGWTGQMQDKRAFPEIAKFYASAGINEDGTFSDNGINQFALINFKSWNMNCIPFLQKHPDCHQVDAKGKTSQQYVCTTAMLTPEFAAYFREQLPAWHKHFHYVKHMDWDFESSVYTGDLACHCQRCHKSFAETYKLPKVPATLDEIRSVYDKEWTEFMNRRFADLADMMCKAVHQVLPGTVYSVYTGYQSQHTKWFYGVDWSMLNGKIDYAMVGYGRREEELNATYAALPDTKLILGELLYPHTTRERYAPMGVQAATLMRRACDANGGILVYEYANFDGSSFAALAQVSRVITDNEPFFLAGNRCGRMLKVKGLSDSEKEVLKDKNGNYLIVLMNPAKQVRSFSATFDLPANQTLKDADGKTVGAQFKGKIPAGSFVVYRTHLTQK